MSNIYKIAVKLTYDMYEPRLFSKEDKFICQTINYHWHTPIYANDEQQAIDKFFQRYNIDNCNPHIYGKIKNIQREIICINKNATYTIKQLQKEMDSNDFLDYIRDKLELDKVVDLVVKW